MFLVLLAWEYYHKKKTEFVLEKESLFGLWLEQKGVEYKLRETQHRINFPILQLLIDKDFFWEKKNLK
jgi:hypothetical protein